MNPRLIKRIARKQGSWWISRRVHPSTRFRMNGTNTPMTARNPLHNPLAAPPNLRYNKPINPPPRPTAMHKTVTAKVINGILTPLEPVTLEEGVEYRITLVDTRPACEWPAHNPGAINEALDRPAPPASGPPPKPIRRLSGPRPALGRTTESIGRSSRKLCTKPAPPAPGNRSNPDGLTPLPPRQISARMNLSIKRGQPLCTKPSMPK